ncbi:MAG TPA: hypothetical protein VEG35_07180 [Burkholderiales bacterium]|nr:hypothetical protein [Burkholderiales bacterium]
MRSSLHTAFAGTKALVVFAALLAALVPAANLAAEDVTLPLKTVEIKHFTQAEGQTFSQEFIDQFYNGLRAEMPRTKVAAQVIDDDGTVADADAANSVVVEGKFLQKKSGFVGIVRAEISLYSRSDHHLIKTITAEIPYKPSPLNTDKTIGHATGRRAAYEIQRALKKR